MAKATKAANEKTAETAPETTAAPTITGALVGYARVSSRTQDLGLQVAALRAAGVDAANHLYMEKTSGTTRAGRTELDDLLSRGIRKGDCLVVTRLDRLARSMRDLHHITAVLKDKGVALRVLEQQIDTSTPEGRFFFNMLGAVAEFETEIRKARQREGIDAALEKGPDSPFKGRPVTIDGAKIKALRAQGMAPTKIAKTLGIARSSVYRFLGATDTPTT